MHDGGSRAVNGCACRSEVGQRRQVRDLQKIRALNRFGKSSVSILVLELIHALAPTRASASINSNTRIETLGIRLNSLLHRKFGRSVVFEYKIALQEGL